MEVVVCFLIGKFWQAEVILLQHVHGWSEYWGEEFRTSLNPAAVDINHVSLLFRHLIEVKSPNITVGKSRIGSKDKKVPHFLHLSIQLHIAHFQQFFFREGFSDRKSTRLNSSHANISYAVFCLKKKKKSYHERINSLHDTNTSF